jgi:hypothetical protein
MLIKCMFEGMIGGVEAVFPDLSSIFSTTIEINRIVLITVSVLALAVIVASLAGHRRLKGLPRERRGVYRRT